ncbi:MAG: chemotaxis protein CheW [Anaerolineae bacterium]
MDQPKQFVVFGLDEQRYALHLSAVETTLRAVEITVLPKAPEIVLGVINMQGRIVPVVNVRQRFRLPEREIALSDRFIIAHTARRVVALVADSVNGVVERAEHEVIAAEDILPEVEYVEGVIKLQDGMVLIHDLDAFLSLDEEKTLDEAMEARPKIQDE